MIEKAVIIKKSFQKGGSVTGAGLSFERVVDVAKVVERLHVLYVGGVRGNGRHLTRVEVTHRDTEHLAQ